MSLFLSSKYIFTLAAFPPPPPSHPKPPTQNPPPPPHSRNRQSHIWQTRDRDQLFHGFRSAGACCIIIADCAVVSTISHVDCVRLSISDRHSCSRLYGGRGDFDSDLPPRGRSLRLSSHTVTIALFVCVSIRWISIPCCCYNLEHYDSTLVIDLIISDC